jgi:peptide/nickel transport system substrate-binding protein
MKTIICCQRFSKTFMLILLILALVFAVSCGQQASPNPPSSPAVSTAAAAKPSAPTSVLAATAAAPASSTPKYGGIFKVISLAKPTYFGYPAEQPVVSYTFTVPIVESLFRIDPKTGDALPKLVLNYEIAPDGKSLTFKLRQGVKFHDGTDFNADAVKWNLDTTRAVRKAESAAITSIDVVDQYTVKLNLSAFNNVLMNMLAFSLGQIISPSAVKTNGKDWANQHPVGTGPFKYESFNRDVSLKLTKFNDYWDKGKPYLDGIEFVFVADAFAGKLAFQSGEGHIIMNPPPVDAADLQSAGFKVQFIYGIVSLLATDSIKPESPFNKLKVRQALEYSIDKEKLVKALGYGFNKVATQLAPDYNGGYNPELKGRPYDPAKAKSLLAEAGYPDGFSTELLGANTSADYLAAIQANLKAVGINVKVNSLDQAQVSTLMRTGWNGLHFGGIGIDPNYCQRLVAELGVPATNLVSIGKPAEWQPLLDRAQASREGLSRNKLIQEAMKMVDDSAIVAPLFFNGYTGVLAKNVVTDYALTHHMQWLPGDIYFEK